MKVVKKILGNTLMFGALSSLMIVAIANKDHKEREMDIIYSPVKAVSFIDYEQEELELIEVIRGEKLHVFYKENHGDIRDECKSIFDGGDLWYLGVDVDNCKEEIKNFEKPYNKNVIEIYKQRIDSIKKLLLLTSEDDYFQKHKFNSSIAKYEKDIRKHNSNINLDDRIFSNGREERIENEVILLRNELKELKEHLTERECK